jgi:hypothetical protein
MDIDRALKIVRALADGLLPPNGGKPWQPDEDRKLIERFTKEHNVDSLAALHMRTANGIRERLVLLGKLAPSN